MKFNFFIIGLGQIGSSLAVAFKKSGVARKVFGNDICWKDYYKEIIDEYFDNKEEGVKKADIIILSTPPRKIIELINEIAPSLNPQKILMDTGSTKFKILEEMRKYPGKILIGGHPMAGSVKEGKNAINGDLFKGKPFFISFPNEKSRKGEKIVKEILERIGGIPVEVDGKTHDFYVSITSHFPYLLSLLLYSLFLEHSSKNKEIENFTSTGFLWTTRLCLTNPSVGEDIVLTNKENILNQIERTISILEKLKEGIVREEISDFIKEINNEIKKRRKFYENFLE